ncbi:ABC transporter permease [Streptomyces sp. TS71-3]|uniref:ABC transporter permease n=1 Tax=Streptomyces sp. TS71-3 TaxID=2733862 RepID=UPI001B1D78C3|nr:ABC transporter permease [Streptomyces sp. TS71-3]GHJ39140.1 membrane protein [Streptomyces sp. TS71-3]
MSSPSAAPPAPEPAPGARAPGRRAMTVIVLVPALVALALWTFAWPASRTAPRDLPLGVVGPAPAAAPVERQLDAHPGAFDIHRYADEADAREAMRKRVVYGAVVATPHGPKLLTASAASPLVAQLLRETVVDHAPPGTHPTQEDVVAAPPGDPRGAVLSASVLPLTISGVATGALVAALGLRGLRAAGTLVAASAGVGLVAAGITDSWLGALSGDWWHEAGVLGLASLAICGGVAGLGALFGRPGTGLGALLMILLGNPFSGANSAPDLLPSPIGRIGQWLPPGAEMSLLRSVAFFDGARASAPTLALSLWAALGLAAVLAGAALRRGGGHKHRGAH